MDFLTGVFLTYSFIGFYFLFLFCLIYLKNRDKINYFPEPKKRYEISVVIPCYNDGEFIGRTIEAIVNNGYDGLRRIVVVDDKSTDNSFEVMKEYEKKYPGLVMAVQTPKNTGNAAGAKNYGAKFVETELICFTDADSFPEKGSIGKAVGFFNDKKVGAVTSTVLVQNRNNLLLKLQSIEYIVIKFTRKLLEFVDSIYVTPGPLAMYRRSYFNKIGKFDETNLTEDIEITWRFLANGYKVKMSTLSKVYSVAPDNIRDWFKQRLRWNMGGVQTIFRYRKMFGKRGMLGAFVLPFFVFSWVIGIFGLFIRSYRLIRYLVVRYLQTFYSIDAQTAIITMKDFQLNPSILTFFGLVLLVLSTAYSVMALVSIKERKEFKRPTLFTFVAFEFFYLLMYPIILIVSAIKLARGKVKW